MRLSCVGQYQGDPWIVQYCLCKNKKEAASRIECSSLQHGVDNDGLYYFVYCPLAHRNCLPRIIEHAGQFLDEYSETC